MSNKETSKKKKQSVSSASEKGSLPDTPAELIDQDLLDEEFTDGYEEGYSDALSDEPPSPSASFETVFEKREDTRSRLAIIYTVLTFSIFFFAIIVAVIDGLARQTSMVENVERIIPLMSGVFLGTLGFVLGYYFRRGDE